MPGFTIGLVTTVKSAFQHYSSGLSLSKVLADLKINGLEITSGALVGCWQALARLYTPFYNQIKDEVKNTKGPLYADETSHREKGKKHWLWAFCTKTTVLFVIRKSRGGSVVLEILGKVFKGILVTDFWKPYLAVITRVRQWCIAHFLREFKKIEFKRENLPTEYWKFKKVIKRLFRDALRFSKNRSNPEKREHAKNRFLKRLDKIVSMKFYDPDINRLVKRLKTYRDGFFTFVVNKNVDATNNFCERIIRFFVCNRKVQFHTMSKTGTETLSIMLTVFKTWELRGLDPYQEALALAKKAIEEEKMKNISLSA